MNKMPSQTQTSPDVQTAIVLARPESATVIGGLPVLTRALLTLRRAGMTRVMVLAQDPERVRFVIGRDARLSEFVQWMPIDSDVRAAGGVLMLGESALFSVALVRRLQEEYRSRQDRPLIVAIRPVRDPAWAGYGEPVLTKTLFMALDATTLPQDPSQRGLAAWANSMKTAMADARAEGRMVEVPTGERHDELWYHTVRSLDEAKAAEESLFTSLRGAYEGFVDTYFNRKLSAPLSRLFLKLGLSANVVTILSIVIGLLGAAAFATGTYVLGIVGALLFQLSAVVDCCDGEIARLTLTESAFGRQLDLYGDNAVHMAIFAALGWAGFQFQETWTPLALGAAAIVGNALSLSIVTRAQSRQSRAGTDPSDAGQSARMEFILKNLASRDFSVVLLAFALFEGLQWFLWLAAIGSNVFWIVTAWATRSSPSGAPAHGT